jgi:hypothetical protein
MTPEQIVQIRQFASDKFTPLKTALSNKKDTGGYEALVKTLEESYAMGVQAGLGSEAKAWAEVNRLEDLIVDLLRYTPDSDIVKARAVAETTFVDPGAYAKAVSLINGSLS